MGAVCHIRDDVCQDIVPGHNTRKDECWPLWDSYVHVHILSVIGREAA